MNFLPAVKMTMLYTKCLTHEYLLQLAKLHFLYSIATPLKLYFLYSIATPLNNS